MKARLLLIVLALASTAGLCNPATPHPPAPAIDAVSVTASPATAGCAFTLSTNTPAGTAPIVMTWSQPGEPTTTALFAYAGPQPYGATITATCPTWQPASTVAVLTGASQAVSIPLTTPLVPPLPAPPTRDQLTHARTCFQGLTITTAQLGAVPSFGGVETGMLTAVADRETTYAAIRAAGCNEIILDVYCHYTEAGVAYPNQTACSNDWTTDHWATLTLRVAEAVRAGLTVLLEQGCDELPFTTCGGQLAGQWSALRSSSSGDLTPFVAVSPGFDGIVPIGNNPPAATSNAALTALLVGDRAVIGNGVLELELPTGWSFAGAGPLSGAGWFTSPGGQAVDVYLQEFANVSPGNGPPPSIIGEFWNAADGVYSPTWSGDNNPWDQVWQVAARTVHAYHPSPDQPFNVSVKAVDGPQAGQTVLVSDDKQGITPNTAGGNPRGPFVIVAAEMSTYQWTHGQTTASAVLADCAYVSATGYDAVACPTSSSASLFTLHRR